MNLLRPFNKLWTPPTPQIARGTGGGLIRLGSGALGRDAACCCNVMNCDRFRGNANFGDIHAHEASIWIRFPAWGSASPYYVEAASVDNECCSTLDDTDYELLIRDYDDATPEFGEFGCMPGMFMPTCMPCYDCEDISASTFTFKYLRAACNSCDVPVDGNSAPYCHYHPELVPTDYNAIWTVEVEVYGYYNTVCEAGECIGLFPSGSSYKLLVVYQVYALTASAPHNYAGSFTLDKVYTDAPDDGDPPNDWAQFYCEAPDTLQLFAAFEPPPP